jgi:protein subunit release factor B
MTELGVREDDILEIFTRSGGPGGQNVNKTATRVQLKHLPSGIEVSCQRERSQAMNRLCARITLLEKIEAKRRAAALNEQSQREKTRRQRRRRPRSLKERILKSKKLLSEKKRMRTRVRWDE